MKLLLDMYRSAPKEQRDKVQLMAAEKKSKSEVIQHCTLKNIVTYTQTFTHTSVTWLVFRSRIMYV